MNNDVVTAPVADSKGVVASVQQRLLELGYVAGGDVDGELGLKTQASILDFRNREGLPLTPGVDDKLLDRLRTASAKVLPVEQVTAKVEDIAPKVEAVSQVAAAKQRSWWAKFTAWTLAIPSLLLSFVNAVVSEIPDAVNLLSPAKSFLSEVPTSFWIGSFGLVVLVLAIMSGRAHAASEVAETKLVEGYQKGTVKNDAPPVSL